MVKHPIEPVYDKRSRILILGSFPSVKSREKMFFYGHTQNRFWRVVSALFNAPCPETVEEKSSFLLEHGIALWDVIGACDIEGSADSAIKNVVPNDIGMILKCSDIENIFVNGKTAKRYYDRFLKDSIKRDAVCLPSTSPANAAWTLEKLITAWSVIKL